MNQITVNIDELSSTIDEALARKCAADIRDMLSGSHFSICVIDSAVRRLGVCPPREIYDQLRRLHCMDWQDMTPQLRESVLQMIAVCLGTKRFSSSIPTVGVIEFKMTVEHDHRHKHKHTHQTLPVPAQNNTGGGLLSSVLSALVRRKAQ